MSCVQTAAERLIVAADFEPESPHGTAWVEAQVLNLADSLSGLGVYLKVNSALRACGYRLIPEIQNRELKVFADLKLFDIPNTLAIDAMLLREFNPKLLTVACNSGPAALKRLKAELPDTEVLGVTVLTSVSEEESHLMFTCSTAEAVLRMAQIADIAEIDGLISSGAEVAELSERYETLFTYNVPAIRPEWFKVKGDDQNPARIVTPAKAIQSGATRIVVGRPITGADNPRIAAERTIAEIEAALAG